MDNCVPPNAPAAGSQVQKRTGTDRLREIISLQGFSVYVLRNQRVEVAVVPALGAKIISLKDLRTGREWMWHPGSDLKLFPNRLYDDFSRSTLVGLDECLPTVAPCAWEGRKLPDHGEAWSMPWHIDDEAWKTGRLTTRIRLAITPFEWERTVELYENELNLNYRLKNLAPVEEPYLWALHPLLRLEKGDQLELPPSTRDLVSTGKWNGELESAASGVQSLKAFARPLREGCAVIANISAGDRLEFNWDAAENNTLGLWLTRGGWHGHHHFAVEPANAADDSLAVAVARQDGARVSGHGTKTWNVRLRVGT